VGFHGFVLFALLVDLLQKIDKVVGHRLLYDLIEHPAQFAPNGALPRARGNRLFPVWLFLFHVQSPALAKYGRLIAEAPVHTKQPSV
jgi:hypothetical protein